jgi:hypothetical protein
MFNAQQFFGAVADQQRQLEIQFPQGFLNIISIGNVSRGITAGSISEVTPRVGAKALVEGTHRLLVPAETEALLSAQAARRQNILAEDRASLRRRINGTLGT